MLSVLPQLILTVEACFEVVLAATFSSKVTTATLVALEASALVAFLKTLAVTLSSEVTATLSVALETSALVTAKAASALAVVIIVIAATSADTLSSATANLLAALFEVFLAMGMELE